MSETELSRPSQLVGLGWTRLDSVDMDTGTVIITGLLGRRTGLGQADTWAGEHERGKWAPNVPRCSSLESANGSEPGSPPI